MAARIGLALAVAACVGVLDVWVGRGVYASSWAVVVSGAVTGLCLFGAGPFKRPVPWALALVAASASAWLGAMGSGVALGLGVAGHLLRRWRWKRSGEQAEELRRRTRERVHGGRNREAELVLEGAVLLLGLMAMPVGVCFVMFGKYLVAAVVMGEWLRVADMSLLVLPFGATLAVFLAGSIGLWQRTPWGRIAGVVAFAWVGLAWPLGSLLAGVGLALLGSAEGARVTSPGYLALLQEPNPGADRWGLVLAGLLASVLAAAAFAATIFLAIELGGS